jgi:hypothetical protein
MDSVIDSGVSLSRRDGVLRYLLPLFPPPAIETKGSHVYALTRLLVTLSDPSLTIPLLTSLVPNKALLAYQFAFDLVEGGAQDFLESLRSELPEGDDVSFIFTLVVSPLTFLVGNSRDLRQFKENFDAPALSSALRRVP